MELATATETADRNTRDLQNGNLSAREKLEQQPVNRVTKDPPKMTKQSPKDPRQPTRDCFCCGDRFHDTDKCRYKDEECYKFHQKGHKANKCHRNRKPLGRQNGCKSENAHHLETNEEAKEEQYTMFHMTTKEKEPY